MFALIMRLKLLFYTHCKRKKTSTYAQFLWGHGEREQQSSTELTKQNDSHLLQV